MQRYSKNELLTKYLGEVYVTIIFFCIFAAWTINEGSYFKYEA